MSSAEQWRVAGSTRGGWPVEEVATHRIVCLVAERTDADRIVTEHNSRAPDAEILRGLVEEARPLAGHTHDCITHSPAPFPTHCTCGYSAWLVKVKALARSAVQEQGGETSS